MRRARTWGWGRTRRCDGPSNDLGPSSPYQSCPDCIIVTRGYDFREGHGKGRPNFNGRRYNDFHYTRDFKQRVRDTKATEAKGVA